MRSRFLATDYFAPSAAADASSSSDQAVALAALPFPALPAPVLPPDPCLPDPDAFPADLLPAPIVAFDVLDSFPVTSAFPEFLAAFIPRPLPVPDIPGADELLGCFTQGVADDYLYGRGGNGNGFSSMDPVACGVPKGLDGISKENCEREERTSLETSTVTKGRESLKELRFEVIEVDFLHVLQSKLASLGDEESDGGVTLSFGVPEVKFHLDFIDMDTETTMAYPVELAESIYQVEKITAKHDVDEDCSDARDSYCLEIAKLDHDVMIPQLEISRHAWELDKCPTKAEISKIFLSIVEHLNDGAQVHHLAFDSTEFLKSDVDMLSLVYKDAPHVDYQADKSITVKAVAEMDLVKINDNILLDKKSAIYPLKPDGTCSDLPCFVRLEEVKVIDFPSKDAFEMLAHSEKAEMKTPDEIFKDDFDSARRFYESVVSSELALSDDTFKSLPVPTLTDDKEMKSVLPPIEEILCSLKPIPLSAADEIYLDWHLLLEGPCNREICSTYASMVEEVKPCSLNSELKTCQMTSDLGIDFLEDFQRIPKVRHEDKKNKIHVPAPLSHEPPSNSETDHKFRKESGNRDHSHMEKSTSEKASSLFESMSQSNSLNFYLSVRSGTNGVKNNENVATLDIPSSNQQAIPFPTRPKIDKIIQLHPVSLSDLIRGLIKDIHVSYTSALRESAYIRHSFSEEQGLSISKQKLLELITGEGSDALYNDCKLEKKMELIVLYALKQVSYYLCFFGLHAAHLYISNLTQSFENIPERLRDIQCCIGAAQLNAQRQPLESHPSLSAIETILRSNTQIGQKILIVSDRAFWLSLGQKLTSMKMTSVELGKHPASAYSDPLIKTSSKTWPLKNLWKSDCILLDNKDIPASFPFCEFSIILEYGGPNKSSTLLSLAPKLNGLPPLHFLFVEVDGEDFPVALIEDNHADQDLKSAMDAVLHTLQKDLQEKMNKVRIVDSLNFIPVTNQVQHVQEKPNQHFSADLSTKLPVDGQLHNQGNWGEKNIVGSQNFVPPAEQLESLNKITIANQHNFVPAIEKSSSTSSISANVMKVAQDNYSASDFPSSAKIDSITSGRLPAPEVVIVVNTGNHGKCMLFSRRSSYQQILTLERGGMQVVERDVNLPVDLILSAAVCLVWYDVRTFGSSDLMVSAERPSLSNFIEDIATNILMSLSFSFSGCIMVFEGESHFLYSVMEAFDSLYASAASLDMNLQIFFSQTPKLTDQIILNCIRNITRINRSPPDVPETESLAESFLSAFPSINPLSAHMILSSGSLMDFLIRSHEQRIQAVEKYLLPPHSISLFSTLCKFGEIGESRSVMTDCSSVDSDISSALLQSPRKRKKCALQDVSAPIIDPACANTIDQLCGDNVEHDKVFSPTKLRKFSNMDTLPELPELFLFDQSLNLGTEGVSHQPRKHDIDAITGNQMTYDDFSTELTPNLRTYNEGTSSMVHRFNFSSQSELGGKKPIKHDFASSRPSLSRTRGHLRFPTASEINNNLGDWDIPYGTNQTSSGQSYGDFATSSCRDYPGSRYHEPGEDIMQNPASSLAFMKHDFGSHQTSQGLGWEINLLRQMNEKRLRQESYGCKAPATLSDRRMRGGSSRILSAPPIESFRYQRNTHTPSRDQSPSSYGAHKSGPIGSARYQITIDTPVRDQGPSNGAQRYGKNRGGTRVQSHRVRKEFTMQPSTNHEKSIVPSIEPTWTPVDKRATKKLSFATYGKEKQSKLVWRQQNSPDVGCVFRKRYREEGT